MDNGKDCSTSIMLVWSNINEKVLLPWGNHIAGGLGKGHWAAGWRIGAMLFTTSAVVPLHKGARHQHRHGIQEGLLPPKRRNEDAGFNIVEKDNINGGYVWAREIRTVWILSTRESTAAATGVTLEPVSHLVSVPPRHPHHPHSPTSRGHMVDTAPALPTVL